MLMHTTFCSVVVVICVSGLSAFDVLFHCLIVTEEIVRIMKSSVLLVNGGGRIYFIYVQ